MYRITPGRERHRYTMVRLICQLLPSSISTAILHTQGETFFPSLSSFSAASTLDLHSPSYSDLQVLKTVGATISSQLLDLFLAHQNPLGARAERVVLLYCFMAGEPQLPSALRNQIPLSFGITEQQGIA